MSHFRLITATVTLALAGCNAPSDPSPPTADENVSSTADTAATPVPAAADFATKAAITDMYEIESSKLAAQNGASEPIQAFATDMIEAHTATTVALKKALSEDGLSLAPPAALDAEHQAMLDTLVAAKGTAFDSAYRSQQTKVHQNALALLQGYSANGDGTGLKAFAAETAPKVQQHLSMLTAM